MTVGEVALERQLPDRVDRRPGPVFGPHGAQYKGRGGSMGWICLQTRTIQPKQCRERLVRGTADVPAVDRNAGAAGADIDTLNRADRRHAPGGGPLGLNRIELAGVVYPSLATAGQAGPHEMLALRDIEARVASAGSYEGQRVVAVGSSRVDLQACKLEYSIVSPK